MKAVVLTRVSSKEQEEGKSLDAQKENLIRYCKQNNLEILETFAIVESSVRGHRKDFYAMLNFCKKQKDPIAILVDAVDRLQRSFKETPVLEELRLSGQIELHFIRENLKIKKDSNPSDIMIWNIHVMLAQSYVLNIGVNVKRSNNYKVENGELPGYAPLGYLNFKNIENQSDIKPDEDRSHLIVKIFERYSKGDISLLQLQKYAYSIGLRSKKGKAVSKQNIVRIIDNRFYYGEMLYNKKIYKHKYRPLISRELWDRCQLIRNGGKVVMPKNENIEHLYRGLITCRASGRICGVDRKKKKNGSVYNYVIYYDQTGTKRFYISEEEVNNQVMAVLRSIAITDEDFEEAKQRVLATYEGEKEFYEQSIKTLQNQSAAIDKKLNNLLDLLINGTISEDIYTSKNEELKKEQREILAQIEGHQQGNYEFRDNFLFFLACKNKFYEEFEKSSSYELKRQLLKFLTRTFELVDGKVEISLRSPFCWMQKNRQNGDFYKWRELMVMARTEVYNEIMALGQFKSYFPDIFVLTKKPIAHRI